VVRLGQEGLTAVRAVRTLIFYIIAYTAFEYGLKKRKVATKSFLRELVPRDDANIE
jgi:hypothetical protein